MPEIINRLSSCLDEIERIIQETDKSPVAMAKVYIENLLLSNNDKMWLEKYAYDYFREIEYSNQD